MTSSSRLQWLTTSLVLLLGCTTDGPGAAEEARMEAAQLAGGGTRNLPAGSEGELAAQRCARFTIAPAKALVITDLSVVEDPVRTVWTGSSDENDGAWSFGRLLGDQAPPGMTPEHYVRAFFAKWEVSEEVNEQTVVQRRDHVREKILSVWPRNADGTLDLRKAPFRLLAISNRFDLRDLSPPGATNRPPNPLLTKPGAGELRFVFALIDPANGEPRNFTVGLEYTMPADSAADVEKWATKWHALAEQPLDSEAYRDALRAITRSITRRGANPAMPNNSNIAQVRTNDLALGAHEMREFFVPVRNGGVLDHFYLALTPRAALDKSATLASYINEHEREILADDYKIPQEYGGRIFRASFIGRDMSRGFFNAVGIRNPRARFHFSLNTCNGCHGRETGTDSIFHIKPRRAGERAELSDFLTGGGGDVADPETGTRRHFNELGRRARDLENYLCEHF